MSVDKAGNRFTKARSINLNSRPQVFRDFVGKSDQFDFYKFQVFGSSSFQATLTNLRADADIRLYDQRGRQIALSAQRGQRSELIREQLASGLYYIRVSRKTGNTSYKLTAATIKDIPGETRLKSLNLGTLGNPSLSIQDSIGWKDTQDWYQFKFENDDTTSFAYLSFAFQNNQKNNVSEVSLFAEGESLIATLYSSNASFQDFVTITSRTYYIRLKSQNSNVMGSYSLSLVFSTETISSPSPPPIESSPVQPPPPPVGFPLPPIGSP